MYVLKERFCRQDVYTQVSPYNLNDAFCSYGMFQFSEYKLKMLPPIFAKLLETVHLNWCKPFKILIIFVPCCNAEGVRLWMPVCLHPSFTHCGRNFSESILQIFEDYLLPWVVGHNMPPFWVDKFYRCPGTNWICTCFMIGNLCGCTARKPLNQFFQLL